MQDNQIMGFTEDQTIMSSTALLAQNWANLATVCPDHRGALILSQPFACC